MASNNCTNTFQSLICIVDIGNIHKGTCRIVIFPCFIWAYKAGTIISDIAMHFEPCHRLIWPCTFLFNSLMEGSNPVPAADKESSLLPILDAESNVNVQPLWLWKPAHGVLWQLDLPCHDNIPQILWCHCLVQQAHAEQYHSSCHVRKKDVG